jgi:lipopolysaccharide export system protein LptC
LNDRLVAWSPLVLIALLAALTFWLDRKVQPAAGLPDGNSRHDPDFMIEGFSAVKMNPDGTRRYALSARRLMHYPDDNSTQLDTPRLVYFDYERAPVTVRSDTADVARGSEAYISVAMCRWCVPPMGNPERAFSPASRHPGPGLLRLKPVRMVEGNSRRVRLA